MCCAIQFVMYVFNVIFWIIGAVMLGLGIWMAADPNALDSLGSASGMDDDVMAAAVYTMIVIGALLFLVGGLGCCGATGNSCIIFIYVTCVTIVIVFELIIVILVAVYWNQVTEDVRDNMYKDVTTKYYRNDSQALTKSWNSMQKNWECCGAQNYTDYMYNLALNPNTDTWTIPHSCCRDGENSASYIKCDAERADGNTFDFLFQKGCYEGLGDWLDYNAPMLIGVTCAFVGLQIIGVITACCAKAKNRKNNSV